MNKRLMIILSCITLSLLNADMGQCSGKSSTGWTIFRKLQSVRPKPISATYYVQGDISGMLYNPSLLALVQGKEINIDTGMGFADERIAGVMYGSRINETLSIGAGLFSYDYGKMALNWVEGNEIMERTVSAQSDYMGMIALGKTLNQKLNAGVSLKLASSRIAEEATAYAFALDGGFNYSLASNLLLSCGAQNIGTSTKFINKSENLPASVMAGLSYLGSLGEFYYVSGVEIPYMLQESALKPSVGFEIGRWPLSFFAGYRTYVDDASMSYGMGLALKGCDFSYSYTPAKVLGDMHRIAIGVKLNTPQDIRQQVKMEYQAQAPERKKKHEEGAVQYKLEEKRQEEVEEAERKVQIIQQLEQSGLKPIVLNPLNTPTSAIETGFFIEEVLDERDEKQGIGFIRLEQDGAYRQIQLAQGVEQALIDFFARVLPEETGTPVSAHVRELVVIEDHEHQIVKLRCRMDFYTGKDSETVKIRTVESESPERSIEGRNILEVIDLLESDLRQLLINCIHELAGKPGNEEYEHVPKEPTPQKVRVEQNSNPFPLLSPRGGSEGYASGGFGAFHQNGGILVEYQMEKGLGKNNYRTFSCGYYQSNATTLRVSYGGGFVQNHTIALKIVPVSLQYSHVVEKGIFRGKWGIGASVFAYEGNASIYAKNDHVGRGVSANLFIPLESMIWLNPSKSSYFIRLDGKIRLLGLPTNYTGNYGTTITGVKPFDGFSLGLFIGKKY